MKISYNKLFKLLIDRQIKKGELTERAKLNVNTLSKMARAQNVNADVLFRICITLDCKLDDIVEILPDGGIPLRNDSDLERSLNRQTPLYQIVPLASAHRAKVDGIAAETWGGDKIAVHGELYELSRLPCCIAVSDRDELLGYCYYRVSDNACEIMALESRHSNIGIATALIDAVRGVAEENHCERLYLQTSNDNIHAFRFYQRCGFAISAIRAIRLNGMDIARKLKPGIPLIGEEGLPLRDEIEFEMKL
jgi:DNA-binding Xre family transcriptional regulator